MGPRSDERGNDQVAGERLGEDLLASMGPRSDERGNARPAVRGVDRKQSASMGPRSDERGNFQDFRRNPIPLVTLQWGRAPMSAEMQRAAPVNSLSLGFNGAALR